MTASEIDEAIARALRQSRPRGRSELIALRDRLQAERGPLDPALGKTWDALVRLAGRSADDLADLLELSEERARWLAAARGAAHPDTIAAWGELGATADVELEWGVATLAWEAIAGAPVDLEHGDPAVLPAVSLALRGLGARCLADDQLPEARRLFERDLALRERLHPQADPQLATSLDNLAAVLERLGDRAASLALRRRQRDVLVAAGASRGQLDTVDQRIAQLGSR